MNELIIPKSPNWYRFQIFDCASDNTVVYAAQYDIIIINPREYSEPAVIEKIPRAHIERINGLSLNHDNWKNPDKLVASFGDDKVVNLWDLNSMSLIMFHSEHKKRNETIAGISLVGDRIVSVSENGEIIIFRISTSNVTRIEKLFEPKLKVKCMVSCPHATWITAIGFDSGLIAIVDLRKLQIIHRMRSTDHDIMGLSWCPTPFNIYDTKEGKSMNHSLNKTIMSRRVNQVRSKTRKSEKEETAVGELDTVIENLEENLLDLTLDEKVDILEVDIPKYNMDERESQIYKKANKKNPWGDIKFEDSVPETLQTEATQADDFLQECVSLRNMIRNQSSQETEVQEENELDPAEKQIEDLQLLDNTKHGDDKENFGIKLIKRDQRPIMLKRVSNKEKIIEKNVDSNLAKSNIDVDSRCNDKESAVIPSEQGLEKEYLLAALGKNGAIHIWRALTDGKLQTTLNSSQAKQRKWNTKSDTIWGFVCWAKPDVLLVTFMKNLVYCWKLLPDASTPEQVFVLEGHRSQIFNIAVSHKIYVKAERTTSLEDFFMWTSSKDRTILCTTIGKKKKTVASYPCLGSSVNAMAVSPIDPSKLAFGLSNSSIRLWDLSISHTQVITMTEIRENKRDKIVSLEWHPEKENYLAYSTFDGQIAQFNTMNRLSTRFHQYHRSCVHKIQWAPLPGTEEGLALYSCSYDEFIYHDSNHPDAKPNKIELDEGHAQNFSWNSEFSILAVGTKEGYVKLLSRNLECYETLYMQKRATLCVAWHPENTVVDNNSRSPYANYLAIATHDPCIYIYDCQTFEEEDFQERSSLKTILEGHTGGVKFLAWCPLIPGRLVAACEDGIIMVWDVILQTLLSTYNLPENEIVSSLIWSPLDADLIIVGYKDVSIEIFRVTKHPPMSYEPEKKVKKKIPSKQHSDSGETSTTSEWRSEEKSKKTYILTNVSKLQNPEFNDSILTCRKILQMQDEPVNCGDEDESSDDELDEQCITQELDNLKIDPAQLFGTRKDMMKILNYEEEKHKKKKFWQQIHHISLWRGDLDKSIKSALKTGVIEPWIINMAPMVSHELWSKLCLQYAEKLASNKQGLEASSYFIACHQIHKAIDALCSSNLYREALALAKCRLSPDDSIIKSIYEQWATYTLMVGNFEVAVECYVKLGKYSEAATLLNKRTEPNKLEFALELAKRSNNHDLEVAINAKLELLNQQKHEILSSGDLLTETLDIAKSRFEALMSTSNITKQGDDDDSDRTLVEQDDINSDEIEVDQNNS